MVFISVYTDRPNSRAAWSSPDLTPAQATVLLDRLATAFSTISDHVTQTDHELRIQPRGGVGLTFTIRPSRRTP